MCVRIRREEVCSTLFYTMCKSVCVCAVCNIQEIYITSIKKRIVFIDAEKDAKRRKFIQKHQSEKKQRTFYLLEYDKSVYGV